MTSHQQLSPELLLERQSSLNVLRDLPDILQSMEKYDSLSEYFIHNLITDGGDQFDFRWVILIRSARNLESLILTDDSMGEVFRLCDLEPQHCQEVFMALEYKTATEKSKNVLYWVWWPFLILWPLSFTNMHQLYLRIIVSDCKSR